jgi:16S rRNA (guanine527-N7)-methyltransferase
MTAAVLLDLGVSRETIDRLEQFSALVLKWTKSINLISSKTADDIWQRHILDSAQIYQYSAENTGKWLDIGSGGGFPGIVVAILSSDAGRKTSYTLIESDQRKATFLRTAIRELDLPMRVLSERIDQAKEQEADVISARALSQLSDLLPMVARHQHEQTTVLLHKGQSWQQEIAEARKNWSFALSDYPSMTDPNARILKLNRIARV